MPLRKYKCIILLLKHCTGDVSSSKKQNGFCSKVQEKFVQNDATARKSRLKESQNEITTEGSNDQLSICPLQQHQNKKEGICKTQMELHTKGRPQIKKYQTKGSFFFFRMERMSTRICSHPSLLMEDRIYKVIISTKIQNEIAMVT